MTLIEAANPARHNRRLIKDCGQMSAVVKRSIIIAGHKTAVSVEAIFWGHFKRIAEERGAKLNHLVASIDSRRPSNQNLSSAIRCFVVENLECEVASAGTALSSPIVTQ